MKIPEQFEVEDKKYSIIGVYSLIDFLHKFIDDEFPTMSAYIIIEKNKPDKPFLLEFFNKVFDNIGTLLNYYKEDKVAVYERMPIIEYPERVCGNCKEYVKHYVSCDSFLGISEAQQGHCKGRHHVFNRNRDDKPKDDKCFYWNAECLTILKQLGKGGDNNG